MAVVSSMVLRSMRLIGEKARGATLDSSEQTECLAEFNTFLDSLAIERLYAFTMQQDSYALSESTSTLTIGTNGTIATTRPVRLVDPVYARDSDGQDRPLQIIDAATYGRICGKSETGPTRYIYYDAGFSATSTGTIHLWPNPDQPYTLFLNSWKTLSTVSTMSQNLGLPQGYQLFLESNFAIHLAAGQVSVTPELAKLAKDSKAAIKSLNLTPSPVLRMDTLPNDASGENMISGGSYYVNDYVV